MWKRIRREGSAGARCGGPVSPADETRFYFKVVGNLLMVFIPSPAESDLFR